MLFNMKKDEAGAVTQFKKTCTYHGLSVELSLNSLTALKEVINSTVRGEPAVIGARAEYTLARRGLIRILGDGELVVTELGILVGALAEAGGLLTFKSVSKEKA
jgi:hypothetical protein